VLLSTPVSALLSAAFRQPLWALALSADAALVLSVRDGTGGRVSTLPELSTA
jgi:hypothetical protein